MFRFPALLTLLLPTFAAAQEISAEFSPNPAPPGAFVTLTATNATAQDLALPTSCGWFLIHEGAPDGPIVDLGIFCTLLPVPFPSHSSVSFLWDQTDALDMPVAPGEYWFELRVQDQGLTTTFTDFACLSIQDATAPTLTNLTDARVGQPLDMSLSVPSLPGAPYFVAASQTADAPIVLPSLLQACIDADPLFAMSFPVPNPTFFTNFQGLLDGGGQASGIRVDVPPAPALAFQSLKVQAIVAGPAAFVPTNTLTFTIDP